MFWREKNAERLQRALKRALFLYITKAGSTIPADEKKVEDMRKICVRVFTHAMVLGWVTTMPEELYE